MKLPPPTINPPRRGQRIRFHVNKTAKETKAKETKVKKKADNKEDERKGNEKVIATHFVKFQFNLTFQSFLYIIDSNDSISDMLACIIVHEKNH